MDRDSSAAREALSSRYVIFSCEGKAERVVVERLYEGCATIVPQDHFVKDPDGNPSTLLRNASAIEQSSLMGAGYPGGLAIARIVDANPGDFKLSKLYRDRVPVFDFITMPEIEALVLVREGEWERFEGRRGKDRQLNASDWCVQRLRMSSVKEEDFLRGYWSDCDDLCRCIRLYNERRGGNKHDQLGLIDLLK